MVVGRALTFADPEVIKLAETAFVPVCADDWYQRRRQDAEGEFFRKVADQSPRKGAGGSTRQGIYVLTADGELLAYKNAGQAPDVMKAEFRKALDKWKRLPAERTKPGAVVVPDHGPLDPNYTRTPPVGGLVVKVHARILDRRPDGSLAVGTCDFSGGDKASRDFLWLTVADCKALAPPKAEVGAVYPVPPAVADRILRFHLLDNTRGEPNAWKPDEVRRGVLTLTVTGATADAVDLRLDGDALLATEADPDKAGRGFEAKLLGKLRYRPATGTFDRFDVAVIGDHWGVGAHTRSGVRPGRTPLGLWFELADPNAPADRIPPQGAREARAYFGKG